MTVHRTLHGVAALGVASPARAQTPLEIAAERQVDALLGGREGFARGGALDPEGLLTVLRIGSEFGLPHKTLTDPAGFVDERYNSVQCHR